jgi:SAM-dependent methyltransferase
MNASAHLTHFERLYRADADPWHVRDSWYEQRKRALLLACLGQRRYRSAFEPGCGNGELSADLAARCERLLAADGSPSAVALARARLTDYPGARVDCLTLPDDWPDGRFDLVVVSELAYYLGDADLRAFAQRSAAALVPGGTLVLCHWRPGFDDRLQATDVVHACFGTQPGLCQRVHHREDEFLLDVWEAGHAQVPS